MSNLIDLVTGNLGLNLLYRNFISTRRSSRKLADQHNIVEFLLWFAAIGRFEYSAVANFTEDYVNFLRVPIQGDFLLNYWLRKNPNIAAKLTRDVINPSQDNSELATAGRLRPLLGSRIIPHSASPTTIPPELQLLDFALGVTVVGAFSHSIGVGEDARTLLNILWQMNVPVSAVDIRYSNINMADGDDLVESLLSDRPIFPVVIFCCPASETAKMIAKWGPKSLDNRYVIGYWPWELQSMPFEVDAILPVVSEIWASSNFTLNTFKNNTNKPVFYVPLQVCTYAPESHRHSTAQSSFFQVCAFADFNSSIYRKNINGTIQAFKAAFPEESSVRLLIKTSHAAQWPKLHEELIKFIDKDPRIAVIDGNLAKVDVEKLISSSDAFISLHRSEGFGRVIAEAMLLETPVICTDWSGSGDFATEDTALLVRCTLAEVREHEYPSAGGLWAEPNIDDAANHLQNLFGGIYQLPDMLQRARICVLSKYSQNSVALALNDRMRHVRDRVHQR